MTETGKEGVQLIRPLAEEKDKLYVSDSMGAANIKQKTNTIQNIIRIKHELKNTLGGKTYPLKKYPWG